MNLAKTLRIESVSRLHPPNAPIVAPDQTVGEAVALMRRENCGCVFICDGDRLRGIFTERDLLQRVVAVQASLHTPLVECMTPNPTVVDEKDSIASAIQKMETGGYRNLPVVDGSGKPVGVLTVKQIVHYLAEHFAGTVYTLPPDPNTAPSEREGA